MLKEHLYQDNPNFDQDKIEATIYQLKKHIEDDANELNVLKGQYFSTNDTVVNKDINTFKLDQVKRTRDKQHKVLEKFEEVETCINEQFEKLAKFKHQFHDFEHKLF